MLPRTLPPELGLFVIDHLGSERDKFFPFGPPFNADHVEALRQCALTCRDWLRWSRINLYHTVYFKNRRSIAAFRTTLEQNAYLRELVWTLRTTLSSSKEEVRLLDVMLLARSKLLPRLHWIHMDGLGSGEYDLNGPTRSCLQMRFETVTSLSVYGMRAHKVLFLLRGFPALVRLRCDTITWIAQDHYLLKNGPGSRPRLCPRLAELKVCEVIFREGLRLTRSRPDFQQRCRVLQLRVPDV